MLIPQAIVQSPGITLYDYTITDSDALALDTGVDGASAGSISGNYRALDIWLIGRTDEAIELSNIDVVLNNDTSPTAYDRGYVATSVASATPVGSMSAATLWGFTIAGANTAANVPGFICCTIPAYTDTTFFKVMRVIDGTVDVTAANTNRNVTIQAAMYETTAAITRIKFSPTTGGVKFKVGTRLFILGMG